MTKEIDFGTLGWVKKELDETLNQARQALEAYVENPEDVTQLRFCATYFHQVFGTLQMVELYGAALLAEEMEHVVQALVDDQIRRREDAYEVLMRAILQLPDYLERLQSGHRDIPLVLLPLLNDMRATRGQQLMSESALFAPDLSAPLPAGLGAGDCATDPRALARSLRHRYQTGLVGWYRDSDCQGSLGKIAEVLEQLQRASSPDPVVRFWWVCGGVADALRAGGLESSISVKLLMGHVDREIKHLIDRGEADFANELPADLMRNLLYYVARSRASSEQVRAIKATFRLDELLPAEDEVVQAREGLAGHNIELMKSVTSAIKEDLARVKDALDLFVRSEHKQVGDLEPVTQTLRQVADTLGMLGLGAPRQLVQQQTETVAAIVAGTRDAGDDSLMAIASALLYVESSLDGLAASHGQHQAATRAQPEKAPAQAATQLPDAEFVQVLSALIREAIADIAKAKEAVIGFIDAPWDHDRLTDVPQLFSQIKGGLQMMSMDRAAAVVDAINRYVTHDLLELRNIPEPDKLDTFADALTSIEYYLEGAEHDRVNRDSVLDVAAQSVEQLGYPVILPPQPEAAEEAPDNSFEPQPGAFETVEADAFDASQPEMDAESDEIVISAPATESEEPATSELAAAPVAPVMQAPAAPAAVTTHAVIGEDVDEEILGIFIEEAQEELANIREQLPRWRDNLEDTEALGTARRSFHTLKGSGRLVGAMLIGEFAWAFESMLNRVIDHTVEPTPQMFALLDRVVEALPELIGQLQGGPAPTIDVQQLMDYAQRMSRPGEVDFPPAAAAAEPEASAPEVDVDEPVVEITETQADDEIVIASTDGASEVSDAVPAVSWEIVDEQDATDTLVMDPVLYEIFCKESAGHLDEIQRFIETCRAERERCGVTESLIRALHTLHGSAHMAGAEGIAAVSSELERLCKELHTADRPLPEEGVDALSEGATMVNALLAVLNVPDAPTPDTAELCGRVAAMHAALVAELEAMPAPVPTPVPEAVAAPEPVVDEVPEPQVQAAPAPMPVATDATPAETASEIDPELVEIFLEESEEILESSEDILNRWGQDRGDLKLIAELQRELHTLKGGARMAGLTAVGDLSHSVESLLTALADGRFAATDRHFDVLHRSSDRLHQMIERVRNNEAVAPADDLVALLHDLLGGAAPQEAEHEPAESQVAAEPEEDKAYVVSAAVMMDDDADDDAAESYEAEVIPLRDDRRAVPRVQHEQVRIRADLLDNLVNYAGEVSIYRARLEQQVGAFRFNLVELDQTVARLREQLRKLEIETEAQILFRYEEEASHHGDFDPLELDRFSHMQQLSRSLLESVSDLSSLQSLFDNLTRESETLLLQQSRVNTELQEGLMRTRMVPFSRLAPRLRRIVRQTCHELDKRVELRLEGAEGEMDRAVIEKVTAPLEHMLRNAVSHGIERPAERRAAGKHEVGSITLNLAREGAEVVLRVVDDGAGINLDAIRAKAAERGLLKEGAELTDNDVMQFILESGFSTAQEITQISGRGVGMDVVNSEIKQLGGSLHIDSRRGKGATFTVRLPFTLAVNHALLVQAGEDPYAISLSNIEGIVRLTPEELERYRADPSVQYEYAGHRYAVHHINKLLGSSAPAAPTGKRIPVLLTRSGDQRAAVQVDGLLGSREIVVKSVGPQISTVRGVSGATILGDGRIVLILDVGAMLRTMSTASFAPVAAPEPVHAQPEQSAITVMVVDDSITVRKVTTRLLERNNMNVITAKDGVDAVALLQDHLPDIMLLDIEMPRMDGYELATHIRNDERLRHIPIIMITSRTGDKHRQRAMDIGVNKYLGKPYQESDLLDNIHALLEGKVAHA